MINVLNKRTCKCAGEYIGRPSVLGNPFVIGKDGDRVEVVEQYRLWLKEAIVKRADVRAEMNRLWHIWENKGELNLICWCSPQQCHGDVIRAVLIEANKRKEK